MKKAFTFTFASLSTLLLIFYFIYEPKTIASDEHAPIIELIDNDLEFYDDEEFDYFDYIKVIENSNYVMEIICDEDIYDVGDHKIKIKVQNEQGNTSYETLSVLIRSVEEINEYVKENSDKRNFQDEKNSSLIELNGHADLDAFELAKDFIGMKGGCNEVAQAYVDAYFGLGYDVLNTYPIEMEEAEPGDIIFYTNSGIGQQHYAVYLGGSSALHGNMNGTTIISYVYMNYGSTPQFRRLNGR